MPILALLAAAIGVGAVAMSANATLPLTCPTSTTDNKSCVKFQFLPNTGLSATTRRAGSIEFRTHTNYAHPSSQSQGGLVSKFEVFFDSDFAITPGTLPVCSRDQVHGKTPKQALTNCGPLGTNNAWLSPSTSTVFNGTFASTGPKGCVLVFNGPPDEGQPTLIIYVRPGATCGNPRTDTTGSFGATAVPGFLAAASAPFGKKLIVNIQLFAPAVAITDLDVKLQRSNYVSAKCSGHNGTQNGSKYWKMKGIFTYSGDPNTNGQPPDTTPPATQTCSN